LIGFLLKLFWVLGYESWVLLLSIIVKKVVRELIGFDLGFGGWWEEGC
jgi:hypothetical protein